MIPARCRHSHPDTKKLWRLVYQLENLRALPRAHGTLPAVIDEILSQAVGPYRNKLEERHDELSDPADWPEAEIDDTPPGPALIKAGIHGRDALTVFKALQRAHARDLDTALARYVTFDFETTDNDVETCGVVEIGAARVINGEIVDRFQTMVNPYKPISARATEVHGYTDADVAPAPPFAEVFPRFRAFIGNDVLIAHNGQHFDIPVMKRLAGEDGVKGLAFYDTLLLAKSLSRDRATQEDIAHRFGIDCGRAHHALDDAVTLAQVYRELEKQRTARARKAVLADLLDYLAVGLALEGQNRTPEAQLLFDIGRFRALGPYSDALEFYGAFRTPDMPTLDHVIERLGGHKLMARLRAQRDPAQRYASAVARLRALVDEKTSLAGSIDALLERVALSKSDDAEPAHSRINLLTLHSTKGLEFSRVYIVGVEDFEIPGYQATTNHIQDEIEEARRLLYVGMTRARQRLTLTRVAQRFGRETGGSTFLEEMGLLTRGQISDKDIALPVLNVKE